MADALALLKIAVADRYAIERELGRGGMATVYLARELKHERRVALKILHPELAATIGPSRFLQEIRVTSRLQHPHILPVFDSGESAGQLWYTMPFVEGESLRQRLTREKQLAVDSALRIIRDVAEALGHAHRHGIVHRDIKPENILLLGEQAVVADFGIAQALDAAGGERLTETGLTLGTPAYMSPEQAAGQREVDGRSDTYSLACVLYEMLAGEPPFTGLTPRVVLARHSIDPVPPLRTVRPGAPAPVEQAITKALAKVPADRYPTVAQFSEALSTPASIPQSVPLRRRALVPALSALGTAVALLIGLNVGGLGDRLKGLSAGGRIRSLAVLPLENFSGDSTQRFFADGITELLITDLAQIGALEIMGRASVMRYRGSNKTTPEIGRELHVDAVVTGRVERSGDKVRITAQLIPAATGRVLWAKGYDRDLQDVLALEGELAEAIANEIKVTLTPEERARLTKVRPVDPGAHEAYLKGRYYWNQRSPNDLKKAIEFFQQSINIDPTYALAYAGMADCYSVLGSWDTDALSPDDAFPKARAAAERALEIDSTLGEAHTSLAFIKHHYEWDWVGAEKEYRHAIALNPRDATAHHWFSHYLVAMGRFPESLAESRLALKLDPLDFVLNVHLGWHYLFARQSNEAVEALRRATGMNERHWIGHHYLGWAYEQLGRYSDAIPQLEMADSVSPGSGKVLAAVAHAYALAGRRSEAKRILGQLLVMKEQRYVSPYEIAVIHVGLGERDQAFEWLERAYQEHSSWLSYLNAESRLDPLHSNPRFADLVRRVGLPRLAATR
jgi:TolB-like protein/Tfp pilus assembly protein PilF/tRNA A-37 threonylcarbamoyl transferase component Bud32